MTTGLARAARDIRTARVRLTRAMGNGRTATHDATTAGLSEVQIARALSVNRATVRRWLGK